MHSMTNAIQFLEALGRSPVLAGDPFLACPDAVEALEVSEAERMALRDRDHAALNKLLDGRVRVMSLINTPDDGSEHEAVPDEGDGDGDGTPAEVDPGSPGDRPGSSGARNMPAQHRYGAIPPVLLWRVSVDCMAAD